MEASKLLSVLELYQFIELPYVEDYWLNGPSWNIVSDYVDFPAEIDVDKLDWMEKISFYKQISIEDMFLFILVTPFINLDYFMKAGSFSIDKNIARQKVLPILQDKATLLQETNITYNWVEKFFSVEQYRVTEEQFNILMEEYSIFINNSYVEDLVDLFEADEQTITTADFGLKYNKELIQHQKMIEYQRFITKLTDENDVRKRNVRFTYFLLYHKVITQIYPKFVMLLEECLDAADKELHIYPI